MAFQEVEWFNSFSFKKNKKMLLLLAFTIIQIKLIQIKANTSNHDQLKSEDLLQKFSGETKKKKKKKKKKKSD